MTKENQPSPLPPQLARTLYNAALVWGVESPEAIAALGPGMERALRQRGVGAARRAWVVLRYLEWRPSLAWPPGRGFSRRAAADRLDWLERIGRGPAAGQLRWLRQLVAEALRDVSPGVAQSSLGA